MRSKIEFYQNLHYGYDLYSGFGSKQSIHNFSQLFFIKIGLIGRFIEKSKKSFFEKKHVFFYRKLALEDPKWVHWENNVSPESVLTFPTNP